MALRRMRPGRLSRWSVAAFVAEAVFAALTRGAASGSCNGPEG
jgi:hypothetical protein